MYKKLSSRSSDCFMVALYFSIFFWVEMFVMCVHAKFIFLSAFEMLSN
jgi:hypothetical protein